MASDSDENINDNFYAHWDPYSSGESEFEGFDIDDIPTNVPARPTFEIDQCINVREIAQDVHFDWCREDSPPTNAPFTGIREMTSIHAKI